jgi:putative heme-binding domain-containing protein
MLASKGTVTFVDLVARFDRKDLSGHLMDMVQATPEKEPGIREAKQIFAFKEDHRIVAALSDPDQAPALLKALGFVGNQQAVEMLRTVATDETQSEPSRNLAITSLGRSSSGADLLMLLVKEKKLSADLVAPAIRSLAASPGPNTRAFAAQHQKLRAPIGKAWPMELLLAAKPNPAKGQAAFQKAGCIACHVVRGEGLDFGPELSDIGTKLSGEQLFDAILHPNQTISLGYEGVNVTLKDRTQLIGFVTGESETTLSLRIPGGLRKDVPKAAIKTRTVMKDSLMPPGLVGAISSQELVDLVAWLGPQRAAEEPAAINAPVGGLPELLAASIHGSPEVDIPAPNGRYTLQLLLYEGWRSRAADIVIEGKTIRERYDLLKEQGGTFHYGSILRHTFTLTDGNIDIEIVAHQVPDIHLGGLMLSKGKGARAVSSAMVKSPADLDFKDVVKAINFGDTRDLSIGGVLFATAAANTTVDGVTNTARGDVYAGEFGQKRPALQASVKATDRNER